MTKGKVLVADDSPLVRAMIREMLESAGLGVVTAGDGLEAVEKAVAEDVAVVILDVAMPRMNGYQACRLLKTEPATRDLPVVILTSKDQGGDRFWGQETGADYYITKDTQTDRILELVKNILAEQATLSRPAPSTRFGREDILSRVNQLLDRKLYEATLLSEMGKIARHLVRFEETFASVMGLVSRVVDFTVGGMAFVEGDEVDVVLLQQRAAAPEVVRDAQTLLAEAVQRERGSIPSRVNARLVRPAGTLPGAEETHLGGFQAVPVRTSGDLAAVLGLGGAAVARLGADAQAFLDQVASQAHIVLENSRLFERVRNLSIRDGLTGLYNHRHIMEMVTEALDRAMRYQEPLSLLMLDVDHFKEVNDAHGHLAGDAVLRELAALLREAVRTVDAVGRYGGEEFLVLLPHTGYEEALQTAERLRTRVQGHAFQAGARGQRLTVSVGVFTCPSPLVQAAPDLVREADRALYRAKGTGRNRVR